MKVTLGVFVIIHQIQQYTLLLRTKETSPELSTEIQWRHHSLRFFMSYCALD